MSQKYDWTEEFRKGCIETGKRIQENTRKNIKEKSSLDGGSLFLAEIERYLASGKTIKVHPAMNAIASYDLQKDESEYSARPERGFEFI